MTLIAHRWNTLEELEATPIRYWVKADVRSRGDRLIIHDPFADGADFPDWIAAYRHAAELKSLGVTMDAVCTKRMDLREAASTK